MRLKFPEQWTISIIRTSLLLWACAVPRFTRFFENIFFCLKKSTPFRRFFYILYRSDWKILENMSDMVWPSVVNLNKLIITTIRILKIKNVIKFNVQFKIRDCLFDEHHAKGGYQPQWNNQHKMLCVTRTLCVRLNIYIQYAWYST